ncbi:MAG: 5'/3'-nucleotidase SurE [Pseudomonadota bacterium]|nr:5'/3'-nucleotidase SurE [Pseudomonadota bacterium]|tara:strand:+ start:296 stop:1033 length:738 start_codon:yes stop_codon:yes gene_type:complete
MKILLSNDDGYKSKGLLILEKSLNKYGSVIVSVPKNNVSACSSSLSVHSDVQLTKIDANHYVINGTAADCVHIATRGVLKEMPDIVFSGINFGSNLGDDIIYSGTVAAAIEGRFCKFAPIAISITSKKPRYIMDLNLKIEMVLNSFFNKIFKMKNIFNVNIPDIPFNKIKGIRFTTLGNRAMPFRAKKIIKNKKTYFSIGPVGRNITKTKNSDFSAIQSGYISITPLSIDMCDFVALKKLKNTHV